MTMETDKNLMMNGGNVQNVSRRLYNNRI